MSSVLQKFVKKALGYFAGDARLADPNGGGLADIVWNQRARLRGVIPGARISLLTNPVNGNVLGIGATTYEFCTHGVNPPVASDPTHTAIEIGVSAAASLVELVKAINKVSDPLKIVYGTHVAAEKVVADAVTTDLRIRGCISLVDRTPAPDTTASIALTATLQGAPAWAITNLNLAGGKKLSDQDMAAGAVTIKTEMITRTTFEIELDFVPTMVLSNQDAAVSIGGPAGQTIILAMTDGVNPFFVNGDIFRFIAVA